MSKSRLQGILDRVSEKKFSESRWLLGAGVLTNYAQSFVDETMKRNAEFQTKAGVAPKIVRKSPTKCCPWCDALVGEYRYPDEVPDDVYRRHDNCNCIVEYYPGDGRRQNVWSKSWAEADEETLEARKTIGLEQPTPPRVFRPANTLSEAAQYAEQELGVTPEIGYSDMHIDVANLVNEEITKLYEIFGNLHDKGALNGLWVMRGRKSYVAAYAPRLKGVLLSRSNTGYKTSLQKAQKTAIEQKGLGFWSTGDKAHFIRHELGHAVEEAYYNGNKELADAITDLRMKEWERIGITKWSNNGDKAIMKKAAERLSYYALADNSEFIAESVAEYMTGNPRELAREVVRLLLQ